MKHLSRLLILSCALAAATPVHAAVWLTDLEAGKAQAAREGKFVMALFTGSDWSEWCIKLSKEILSQPEFDAFAHKHLVLVEIDLPKQKPLTYSQKTMNANLVAKYRVDGFPTMVFLNSKGDEVVRGGYEPGGPKLFVQAVSKSLGLAAPAGVPVAARQRPSEPERPAPLFGGAQTAPPVRYSELTLKSISGTKDRRFALINNQTFAVGDVAGVKLEDKIVRVRCAEIREKSVVVAVEGQEGTRELALRDP